MSSTTLPTAQLLDELTWRGMLSQYTEGLPEWLARGAVTAYCGFDPSAPSLHVGNLVPVMGLAHLQRAGHRPIVLVGGGTGMIGDPSGKTAERQLNSPEVVEANTRAIRSQLERFLDFSGTHGAIMRDNAEWLLGLGAVEFMRDVGKHFTVNYMLQKESVKSRMEAGISYTEFSYMLLQSYDYLELHRREGATLQIGGSDQWGNITAGVELIRRTEGKEAHALTLPLVTTASGTKFGKTEAGAVWLDPARSSPYRMYQFWINTDDRDVGKYLRFFTLLGREEIEALDRETLEHPERRTAQQALANDVTSRVHGAEAGQTAAEVSALLFGKAEARQLSRPALDALAAEVPFVELPAPGGGEIDVLDLFVAAKLTPSKGAARRLLEQGGLNVNGRRLSASDRTIEKSDLLPGSHLLLRKGARDYALVRLLS
ncbi:MAG TPA: tyrosine--tRNA ligase [Gemmatimonadaceae bacterium]|jgi:tyrosyl-tRNA synthetase|nr:tyrosine--tRNA ligase [Gemmatimonadaceae bacterium]